MWEEKTFRSLIEAEPERLVSRFAMHHGLLLNILARRDEDGCFALRKLIRDCHENAPAKKKLRRRAFALFRGLIVGKILTFIPKAERRGPAKVALHIELQEDFSLNQVLGLYLLEAIAKLDFDASDYALNVLSVIESILEDPGIILRRQVEKAKTALVAEMKAEGLDSAGAPVLVQCFEVGPLKTLATLSKAPRVQLVSAEGGPADLPGVSYSDMVTAEGLKAIAGYAQALGPEWRQVISINAAGGLAGPTPLVANAHAAGLKVIPWTVRAENAFLPPALRRGTEPGAHGDVATLLKALFAAGVDGLFTDFPDLAVAARGA